MLKYLIIFFFFSIHLDSISGIPSRHNYRRQRTHDASDDFDILVLSQLWPQTSCWHVNAIWSMISDCSLCDLPNTDNNWTLHGLWPSNKRGGSPEHCNLTAKFSVDNLHKDIRAQMDTKWGSSKLGKGNLGFWKHEWEKHGTCALKLKNTDSLNDYFNQSLYLLDKYNVGKILSENNIIPGNTYEVREIYDAIQKNLNASPYVKCARNTDKKNEQYLLEVNICFDKTFALINCKDKDIISNCNQNKAVIYPEKLPSCYYNSYDSDYETQ